MFLNLAVQPYRSPNHEEKNKGNSSAATRGRL